MGEVKLSDAKAGRRWRVPCPRCDEGFTEGCTCMDDTCCCLEPDPPPCEHCHGRGYYIVTELTDENCEEAIEIAGRASSKGDGE